MPKREDENWVRWRDDKEGIRRETLCPFCGKGGRVYYNKHFKSWRCGWCEKSFSTPSGGKPIKVSKDESILCASPPSEVGPIKGSSLPKGEKRPICPFCGRGDGLSYSNFFASWKCDHCGRFIPTPSGLTPLKDEFVEHHERQGARPRANFVKSTPPTRKKVSFRKRRLPWRKVLLLLLLAFGIVIIVYTAYFFIDHRVSVGTVVGVAAASIIVLLWNIPVVKSRYRRAKPGRIIATLVAFTLIGATMLAFAGIAPFSTAMDTVEDWFGMNQWVGPHGEKEHEYVMIDGAYMVGGDGQRVELFNNPNATNPTWSKLKEFLRTDTTDKIIYEPDEFVCADFAEMLHNNAEAAGIMAAYVSLDMVDTEGHACNLFETTDGEFVYIDDTGVQIEDNYPSECSNDTKVNVEVGMEYIPELIFPCGDWYSLPMGTVTNIDVKW